MESVEHTQTSHIGKRGTWVVPAGLRRRYGLEEGTLVIAELRPDGILLKPATANPILPSPENQSSAWSNWFDLMSEVKATAHEIAEARTLGRR